MGECHDAGLFLFSPEGKLVRVLFGIEFDPKTLRLGLVEASQCKLGGVWDHMLLACYTYDANAKSYVMGARRVMKAGGAVTAVGLGLFLRRLWKAERRGIALPTALDGDDAAEVERLGALRGAEFDQAYMMFMAGETARMLALYRWQYDNCTNADLKPFAMQTMPIIAVHARVADELNKVVNKEALRLAAERKAAEAQAAAQKKAEEEAAAAAAAAKKKPTRKPARRSSSSSQG